MNSNVDFVLSIARRGARKPFSEVSSIGRAYGEQSLNFQPLNLPDVPLFVSDATRDPAIEYAITLSNIGVHCIEEGECSRAKETLEQALNVLEGRGDVDNLRAVISSNMGDCFFGVRDWHSSFCWYKSALGYAGNQEQLDDFTATVRESMAAAAFNTKQFEVADRELMRVIKFRLSEYPADLRKLAELWNSLAEVQRALGNFSDGKGMSEEAAKIYSELPSEVLQAGNASFVPKSGVAIKRAEWERRRHPI